MLLGPITADMNILIHLFKAKLNEGRFIIEHAMAMGPDMAMAGCTQRQPHSSLLYQHSMVATDFLVVVQQVVVIKLKY